MDAAGVSAAELARRVGVTDAAMRKYTAGSVSMPRGDALDAIARELGVYVEWLRIGVGPRSGREAARDDADRTPALTADDYAMMREFGVRLAGARRRRGMVNHDVACRGIDIVPARWRALEEARARPTLLELQLLSDRLWTSLDYLVSGRLAPIDDRDPAAEEALRRTLHEPKRSPPRR